jgi:hypothetical protein
VIMRLPFWNCRHAVAPRYVRRALHELVRVDSSCAYGAPGIAGMRAVRGTQVAMHSGTLSVCACAVLRCLGPPNLIYWEPSSKLGRTQPAAPRLRSINALYLGTPGVGCELKRSALCWNSGDD